MIYLLLWQLWMPCVTCAIFCVPMFLCMKKKKKEGSKSELSLVEDTQKYEPEVEWFGVNGKYKEKQVRRMLAKNGKRWKGAFWKTQLQQRLRADEAWIQGQEAEETGDKSRAHTQKTQLIVISQVAGPTQQETKQLSLIDAPYGDLKTNKKQTFKRTEEDDTLDDVSDLDNRSKPTEDDTGDKK